MRVELHDGHLHVYVSRRNILALLAKLDGNPPDSNCTIVAGPVYPETFITAEEDEKHYSHESRQGHGPGLLDPSTEVEVFVRNWEKNQTTEETT